MSHFCKGLCLPLSGAVSPESAAEFYSHVRPEESQCWGLYLNTHTKQADVQIHRSGSCAVPAMKETPLKEGDELQHTQSITWLWGFGINDGKTPGMPEHSVSKDVAVALRSTGLVLVNVPMLQLLRVRNECQRTEVLYLAF